MTHSEIRALARLVDRLDYYRLLRVPRQAQAPEIRTAYRAARRQFHPDAFSTGPADLLQAVERIARRVTEAYTVLRDPERRSVYDQGLEAGALRYAPGSDEAVRRKQEQRTGATPNGRRFSAMAQEAERLGDVPRAISHLKMALAFESTNETFRARLADLEGRRHA